MIVVATADFSLYHDLVAELRDRAVEFTTAEPGDPLPDGTDVVVVGPDDEAPAAVDTVVADPEQPRRAVETAIAALRGDEGPTVVGIDPGRKPGVAVLSGDRVVAAHQIPVAEVGDVVSDALEGAVDPTVRVGDGARLRGLRIVEALPDAARVEVVDETGTTPSLGTGARGMGDVIAAINIARIEGEETDSRDVDPTPGELQVVKERARERGDDRRTIDDALARRVAVGDLTIEEALAEHRQRT